jgi:micrococcal nuclease
MRSYLVLPLLLAACGTSSSTSTAAIADTVQLLRVFDGDSFEIDEPGREVRLLGLNAPERSECLGDEATSQLAALLSDAALTLEGPGDDDQFGRELRYVRAGDAEVGMVMISRGLALATSDDHPRRRAYAAAEAKAVEGGLGMWASNACGARSGASVTIAELEFDAPGDDASNPNGERITLRNDGTEPVMLRGWGIRDESSRHRYEFPDVTLDPGESLTLFSGCGDDRPPTDLYWCAEGAVWNNGGDTALLQDPNGNVVDRVVYGDKS